MNLLFKVKISSKGQITLPKKIRNQLDSDYVDIVAKNNKILLQKSKPITQLAGSLKKYSKNKSNINEKEVWAEYVREKYSSN